LLDVVLGEIATRSSAFLLLCSSAGGNREINPFQETFNYSANASAPRRQAVSGARQRNPIVQRVEHQQFAT
jgi:hypothetical protein